jgi:amino acid transporter
MATTVSVVESGGLRRDVGLIGLTFFSVGSIIGSGWLFGAMNAAKHAGPAAVLAWPLAGVMLIVLSLIHAELGGAYPLAGGTARFSHYAFGGFGGYTIGWPSWIYSMAIAPIEVEAALTYGSAIKPLDWMTRTIHSGTYKGTAVLTVQGYFVAAALMLVFTAINMMGVKVFSETNQWVVWWKIAIPVLTVVVLLFYFRPHNFNAQGGFFPSSTSGTKGMFLALPLGVVFGEMGFEAAIQMAGEARRPHKDVWRAVILSTAVCVAIYSALQLAFLGALKPSFIQGGWPNISFTHAIGPYAGLTDSLGLTWLLVFLYADAFISPAGTGLVYIGTQSRLLYGMGRERYIPRQFARLSVLSVPYFAIFFGWVVGMFLFLPFPGWETLVSFITSAAVLMYAAGPLAMAHLRRADPDRPRPFRLPVAILLNPIGFIFATLLVYWSGWPTVWRLLAAMVVGYLILVVSYFTRPAAERPALDLRHSIWIWPFLIGMGLLSYYGSFQQGEPGWFKGHPLSATAFTYPWDTILVTALAVAVYVLAMLTALPHDQVRAYTAADHEEVEALTN